MIPLLEWLPGYRRDWLRADVVAGLTTAAVVIPKSMAYATVAGLPIQVGLYTAFVPMIVYAALGTSRPLSVSTSTTLAILTAAQLGEVARGGDPAVLLHATAMLTVMVGVCWFSRRYCGSALWRISFPNRCSWASKPALRW